MSTHFKKKILALSGGVGGAKLAHGLSKILEPEQLMVVTNTGDDFTHLGFTICPDMDTVMYTLAEIANKETLWGVDGETWQFMDALAKYDEATWFKLGDRDLATHVVRKELLKSGHTLTEVSRHLCLKLGVEHRIIPMSDDPVETWVETTEVALPFQEYFVKEQCKPVVSGFSFKGIDNAKPNQLVIDLLKDPDLAGIVICPSNPFVSVEPILSLPGMRKCIIDSGVPVVCISPIVGGKAIKGPTAKMMRELSMPASATAVAQYYQGLISGFVVDLADEALADEIRTTDIEVLITATVMTNKEDKIALAVDVLKFIDTLND